MITEQSTQADELRPGARPAAAHDAELAISVQNVSKMYRIYERPQDRLKQMLWRGRRMYGREFWALRNASFEIHKGETLAIIGRNGSGKSTLLQIIAGTMAPTEGQVQVNGRVAALLELGSGFNPEFTGRENVFLNGAILGMSQAEMERRFDDIAAFADIGHFIDQPVKFYSSGMVVRLAFAVQASVSPEILIVDEALAVGDMAFQRKCYRRIESLRENLGTTILMVTHDMNAVVRFCSRAILLENGRMVVDDVSSRVCDIYQKKLFGEDIENIEVREYGDRSAEISDIWFENMSGEQITSIRSSEDFCYCYKVAFARPIDQPIFGMRMTNVQGTVISATNSYYLGIETKNYLAGEEVVVRWHLRAPISPGSFFFSCGCSYLDADRFLCRRVDAAKLTVIGALRDMGLIDPVVRITFE